MNPTKYYQELDSFLINKEVFCNKNITDENLQNIVNENTTILFKKVDCHEIREDTHAISAEIRDLKTQESKKFTIYCDGGMYALGAFIKTTFYPVNELYKERL